MEPDAPDAPEITDIFHDCAVVTWQPPDNDGGSPVIGYYLERKSSYSPRWVKADKDMIPETSFKAKDLIEDNEYEFRVIAENKAGLSKPSPPSKPFTAKDPWGEFVHW